MLESKRVSMGHSLSSLNMRDLKYQIGYENIKDNLYPDFKSTKKLSDNSKSKRTIQIKIIQNEKNIDKMLNKVVELDNKNNKLNQIYNDNSIKKKIVEKEVSTSNNLHNSIILEKKQMKKYIDKVNLKRQKIESKTHSLSVYINDLKYKNKHTKETIISFEREITSLKESISKLKNYYQQRYQGIDADKFGYYDQTNFLNNLIIEQEIRIDELGVEKELINRKIEEDKKHYQSIQDINELAYVNLEKKFHEETQILYKYKMSADLMQNETQWIQSVVSKNKSGIKTIEKDIKLTQQKNEMLKNKINELTLQLSKVKTRRRLRSGYRDRSKVVKNSNVSFNI